MNDVTAPPDRRMNLGSWLVLAIAVGYLVTGVVHTLLAFQQPTDGWYYNTDDATVEFSQGGVRPLQPGDRVIAIAGRSLAEDSDFVRRGPPPGWQLGATVPYTVVRDGTTIELEVPLVRRQPSTLLRSLLAGSVIGNFAQLFCLVLGLVVFFLGCIVVLQQLVVPLVGGSELAIVASTLAIAALFNPLRRRIQNVIDKRFYRRKYDAAKVLAAFGATARDETNLEQLTAAVLQVVDETVQPEFVGL